MRPTHLAKYTVLAGALAVPLSVVTSTPASAAGDVSSAYGVYGSGTLAIPAQPWVTSSTQPNRRALELPKNPLLNLALFTVEAHAHHASASVADLRLTHPALPGPEAAKGLLAATAIAARCDDGVGSAHLADVAVAGHTLPAEGPPNTDIDVPAKGIGLRVSPNKQVHNPDGTLTVIALELNFSLGGDVQTVDIASATCGRPGGAPVVRGAKAPSKAGGQDGRDGSAPAEEAPRPTPVPTDLAVTG